MSRLRFAMPWHFLALAAQAAKAKNMVEPIGIGRANDERFAVPAAIHSELNLPVGRPACLGPPARFGTGPRAPRASNGREIPRRRHQQKSRPKEAD